MTTPTVQPVYGSFTTVTITLASLATSSTWVAGREATAVTNSSSLYDDVHVSGKITVGTSPTANTQILIYAVAALSATPTWPDTFTGSDANLTLTSVGIGAGFLQLARVLSVDSTTSDRTYPFDFWIAHLFGGNVPRDWTLFVTHNTGANLNATAGNHSVTYQGVNYALPSI